MKTLYYFLLIVPILALGQNRNYTKSILYKVPTIDGVNTIDPVTGTSTLITNDQKTTNITLYDEFGRPVQKIAAKQSATKKDIVQPVQYDVFGRQVKTFLPYVTSDDTTPDSYNPLIAQQSFYSSPTLAATGDSQFESTTVAYAEQKFETSPLNRVTAQGAPGTSWSLGSGHNIRQEQYGNDGSIRRFKVYFPSGNTENTELRADGYFPVNQLYKTIIKDENWVASDGPNKTTEEYHDNEGKLVLKRSYSGTAHDTYYVYDKFSSLTYVIPPLASDNIITERYVDGFLNINHPWTTIGLVDGRLAADYERELIDYDNSEILNLDLIDKYGGQGGFSITPDENGGIVLNLNISTLTPMPYKTGEIIRLDSLGNFSNRELGRVAGTGYEYIFLIHNNALAIEGSGNVPSVVASFSGTVQLDYQKNYPWSKILRCDPQIAKDHETAIIQAGLNNNQILNTYTPNPFNAMGGVSVSLDEDDTIAVSINISTDSIMALNLGNAIPLDFSRRVSDRYLGEITGNGYSYRISISNNALNFTGSGTLSTINFTASVGKVIRTINTETIEGLCYIYNYDSQNRLIRKHIPGKGWQFLVYDKLDRLVMTQDENQRLSNKWLFNKYDKFGRVIYTGECINTNTHESIRNSFSTATVLSESRQTALNSFGDATMYYTNSAYPQTGTLLTVQYYDDYQFGVSMPSQNDYTNTFTTKRKGLATGSKVRVLDTTSWIISLIGYDDKGRVLYTSNDNPYLSTVNTVSNSIDFLGKTLKSKIKHNKSGTILTIEDFFEYDHADRLLKHYQQTGTNPQELIVYNRYSELGQLVSKKVGGSYTAPSATYSTSYDAYNAYTSGFLQEVDYAFNIRGWMKSINNINDNLAALGATGDLFAFKINYNTKDFTASSYLYNGNISETRWKTKNDNKIRSYSYTYDGLNRLTSATTVSTIAYNGANENFAENLTYDKNGNIQSLDRYGLNSATNTIGKIDALIYTYTPLSNALKAVKDNAIIIDGFNDGATTPVEYTYDNNGNLTSDVNKSITGITYNHFDMPKTISFGTNKIEYVYDATGNKLQKKVTQNGFVTITDYNDGFIYQKAGTGTNELQYFAHEEGYVKKESGIFSYVYQYIDHLGNVRLSYRKNGITLQILEEDNYYAFGLKHKTYNTATLSTNIAQKLEYNDKELQDELGLNMYDYGARNYDPAIGRWMNIDPLAEKSRRWSPYTYAYNNPVFFVDPDGMFAEGFFDNKAQTYIDQQNNKIDIGDEFSRAQDHKNGWEKLLKTANEKAESSPSPFSTQDLFALAEKSGVTDKLKIGDAFESAALGFLGLKRNGINFKSPERNTLTGGEYKGVRPDAVKDIEVYGLFGSNTYKNSSFVEIKAVTGWLNLEGGSGPYQVLGLIDAASSSTDAGIGDRAILTFYTTSNTIISPYVIQYADQKHVTLKQAVAYTYNGLLYFSPEVTLNFGSKNKTIKIPVYPSGGLTGTEIKFK